MDNLNQWHSAEVVSNIKVNESFIKLSLKLPSKMELVAGQHFDIRLTAPDGYQAQRSYSILNPGGSTDIVEFGIEVLPLGELSPALAQLEVGNVVELKGPIGRHFVWNQDKQRILLIGGGSGTVPLVSIFKTLQFANTTAEPKFQAIFLASFKQKYKVYDSLFFNDPNIKLFLTQESTVEEPYRKGRIQRADLQNALEAFATERIDSIYICGRSSFVEELSQQLLMLGVSASHIKAERFG